MVEEDYIENESGSESISPNYILASFQASTIGSILQNPFQDSILETKKKPNEEQPPKPKPQDVIPPKQTETPNLKGTTASSKMTSDTPANKMPRETDETTGLQNESYDREKAMLDKNKSYDNYGDINLDAESNDTLTASLEQPIVYNTRFRSCKKITYEQHKV